MDETRQRLERELAAASTRVADLEADLALVKAASESSNADDEHDPEGATIAFERQQLTSLLSRTRRTRSDLADALAQLDAGGYGICRHCGKSISPDRLPPPPRA